MTKDVTLLSKEVNVVIWRGEALFGKSWVWAGSPTARLFCGREGVRVLKFLAALRRGERSGLSGGGAGEAWGEQKHLEGIFKLFVLRSPR